MLLLIHFQFSSFVKLLTAHSNANVCSLLSFTFWPMVYAILTSLLSTEQHHQKGGTTGDVYPALLAWSTGVTDRAAVVILQSLGNPESRSQPEDEEAKRNRELGSLMTTELPHQLSTA